MLQKKSFLIWFFSYQENIIKERKDYSIFVLFLNSSVISSTKVFYVHMSWHIILFVLLRWVLDPVTRFCMASSVMDTVMLISETEWSKVKKFQESRNFYLERDISYLLTTFTFYNLLCLHNFGWCYCCCQSLEQVQRKIIKNLTLQKYNNARIWRITEHLPLLLSLSEFGPHISEQPFEM